MRQEIHPVHVLLDPLPLLRGEGCGEGLQGGPSPHIYYTAWPLAVVGSLVSRGSWHDDLETSSEVKA